MTDASVCADVGPNDWTKLVPDRNDTWVPNRTVSICIPARNPGPGLARTLRCLGAQTYPAHLIEIIVADDGSDSPIVVPEDLIHPVRVVRQERTLAFGAGPARNLAARAASGEILCFLDAEVIPEREVVAAYARWFDRCDLAVPLGVCRFVDIGDLDGGALAALVTSGGMADRFADQHVDDQEWREDHFQRTRDLRDDTLDAFRVMVAATLAVSAAQYREVGGFPELGIRGVEDTVFGYRLHVNGGVLIVERDAMHWHQGRGSLASSRRDFDHVSEPYLQASIPVPGFRGGEPPVDPPVEVAPVTRVRVHGDGPARDRTVRSVERDGAHNASLQPGGDPAADFDTAFAQVDLPAGVLWTPTTVTSTMNAFAAQPVGVIKALCNDPAGSIVTIARTRAVRRGRHVRPHDDPITAAGELFGIRWMTSDMLDIDVTAAGADDTAVAAGSRGASFAAHELAPTGADAPGRARTAVFATWLYDFVLGALKRATR